MVALNKNTTDGTDKFVTTYYVRDPQGNVLAVYEHKRGESGNGTFTLTEQHLYGASRLGMKKRDLALNGTNASETPATYYELTNHLGNVMAVISDEASSSDEPTVVSLSDYYPFGMSMPERSWNADDYRFGYTGHEKENDLAEGVYTTEYRLLDTRLGRWLSVDPLFAKYPGMSSYNYCAGNPMVLVDPRGLFDIDYNGQKDKLSDKAIQQFELIVKNAEVFLDDDIEISLLNNKTNEWEKKKIKGWQIINLTTGRTEEQIREDFKYGNGAKIYLTEPENSGLGIYTSDNTINIPLECIEALDLNRPDLPDLNDKETSFDVLQAFYLLCNIYHEYAHYGDQLSNDGKNSGQNDGSKSVTSGSIPKGSQEWEVARTGHRGTDVAIFIFGIDPSAGKTSFDQRGYGEMVWRFILHKSDCTRYYNRWNPKWRERYNKYMKPTDNGTYPFLDRLKANDKK
jgi:RHS repeat-associated protein